MRKLYIFVLFLFIFSGCSDKKDKSVPTDLAVSNPEIEMQDDIKLHHNPANLTESNDEYYSELELYMITESAIGYRLERQDASGKMLSSSASRSSDGTIANPNEKHLEPMTSSITLETRGEGQLSDMDYTYFKCKAIFADLTEQDCKNTLMVEELGGYRFGPIYIVEKDGEFFFTTTK